MYFVCAMWIRVIIYIYYQIQLYLSKEVHILEFQKRTSEHDFQKGTIFFFEGDEYCQDWHHVGFEVRPYASISSLRASIQAS